MESKNPIFRDDRLAGQEGNGEPMSVLGTINKTTLSLLLMFAGASFVWVRWFSGDDVFPLMIAGALGALALVIFTLFRPGAAPVTVPVYAVLEGFLLGGVSAYYSEFHDGIILQAILITVSVMLVMLILYRTRIIRATAGFRKGVILATLSVLVVYLLDFLLRLFGLAVPFLHESGTIGIVISLVIVGIASLNFILDFDQIERGVAGGAPKQMEWIGALGLMTTLVWLYFEILRLLSLLQNR